MSTVQIVNLLRKIVTVLRYTPLLLPLTALIFALTGTAELVSVGTRQETVSTQCVYYFDSFERSQGITTDGESFYFSHKYGLLKTGLDGKKVVARNFEGIPAEMTEEYGIKHIGGISYHNGKIYCPLEDSKVWKHPMVLIYDAQTLEFTGEFYHLDAERHSRGLPWIAVDAGRNLVYTASRDNSHSLICYSLTDFTYVRDLPLVEESGDEATVHKIQGGEVYDGKLYVATNNDTQAVYEINLDTGLTVKLFDRNLTKGSEGEGITVLPMEDGSFLHALDMGPLFVNAYIRHYTLPGEAK